MLRFLFRALFSASRQVSERKVKATEESNRSQGTEKHLTLVPSPEPQQKAGGQRSATFDAENAAPAQKGRVIQGSAYVTDGDTIVIKKTQIRLFGVDAPELGHPYGQKAKWAMVRLCKGQTVRAEITDTDTHGRTVARCYLQDGRDLSAEMVKQGLAIDWPKFSGGIYSSLEMPDLRKKLWLADARQKGRMHVWEKFELNKSRRN
ncbi:thermonuclease family protein [Sulfitobacter sabulilitoris]|uniref:TNase-like domain-containing protein n=1 Tax=Sulfitobacter sabulilitoris TaxID=2562655 RepID=A0A5S3PMJ9_9RHOB|nr:thermonuclease family protein [Sulfitobacter sabulilitoris]TMM55638.1 hypothetical protein FDT80_06370 [Sulfitobacter sabulilitoris]